MSTDWGYRCQTCQVDSPTWFNHGDDFLEELYKLPEMLTVYDFLQEWDGFRLRFEIITDEIEFTPLDFLKLHQRHEIVLANEYGDIRPFKED